MYIFQLPEIASNSCNFGRGITLFCVSLRLHCIWGRETLWTMWIQSKQLVGETLCTLHPDLDISVKSEAVDSSHICRWGNKSGPFWS